MIHTSEIFYILFSRYICFIFDTYILFFVIISHLYTHIYWILFC
nr:MAG TPA: hypothetical protein [Crassvirales sp.]